MSNKQQISLLPKGRSLVIVGLMGAGKTCIGRRIAKRCGVRFIDADREIEEAAGRSIADIFDQYGEEEFRRGEHRVIKRILEGAPCVLATGGGAFMNNETRQLICETGTSLWLKAHVDVLIKRTKGRRHRPLLNQGNPMAILQKLMSERYSTYEKADVTVDTLDENLDVTIGRVLAALNLRA